MYTFLKKGLFLLPPECAHAVALKSLRYTPRRFFPSRVNNPQTVFGLTFKNRVGLAAGLDKNGEHIHALAKLGFAFIEVGTVTPKAQEGNTKPRLFRLTKNKAIINRMGFNNKGVDYLVAQVKKTQFEGVLGINIGKNLTTPINEAVNDYLHCLLKVYPFANYITVNVSSPNTPGLRDLQLGERLNALLTDLKESQQRLADKYKRYVPLLIKLSPDETEEELKETVAIINEKKIDGIIASNTTCMREALRSEAYISEAGGLSGEPLTTHARQVVLEIRQLTDLPIIGVGGISKKEDGEKMLKAGANLLQMYTGLIYQGPSLVHDLACI